VTASFLWSSTIHARQSFNSNLSLDWARGHFKSNECLWTQSLFEDMLWSHNISVKSGINRDKKHLPPSKSWITTNMVGWNFKKKIEMGSNITRKRYNREAFFFLTKHYNYNCRFPLCSSLNWIKNSENKSRPSVNAKWWGNLFLKQWSWCKVSILMTHPTNFSSRRNCWLKKRRSWEPLSKHSSLALSFSTMHGALRPHFYWWILMNNYYFWIKYQQVFWFIISLYEI